MMRRERGMISRGRLLLTAYWLALLGAALASVLLAFPPKSLLLAIIVFAVPVYFISLKLDAATRPDEDDLAFTDDVTGLGNRRAFHRDARKAILRAGAGEVGVVLFDVDGLKALNDQCGIRRATSCWPAFRPTSPSRTAASTGWAATSSEPCSR